MGLAGGDHAKLRNARATSGLHTRNHYLKIAAWASLSSYFDLNFGPHKSDFLFLGMFLNLPAEQVQTV
jgi:hypothetical protein